MARLRWSVAAERDLVEIGEFVARDSFVYAVRLLERLVAGAELLIESPHLGRVVPEYDNPALREMIVRKYRLVYLLEGDVVTVVRAVHGARDFRSVLGDHPWLMD